MLLVVVGADLVGLLGQGLAGAGGVEVEALEGEFKGRPAVATGETATASPDIIPIGAAVDDDGMSSAAGGTGHWGRQGVAGVVTLTQ